MTRPARDVPRQEALYHHHRVGKSLSEIDAETSTHMSVTQSQTDGVYRPGHMIGHFASIYAACAVTLAVMSRSTRTLGYFSRLSIFSRYVQRAHRPEILLKRVMQSRTALATV
jgi:hypothetical protein